MNCSPGILLRWCAFAMLAALPCAVATGQDGADANGQKRPDAVTRVEPVGSPAASPSEDAMPAVGESPAPSTQDQTSMPAPATGTTAAPDGATVPDGAAMPNGAAMPGAAATPEAAQSTGTLDVTATTSGEVAPQATPTPPPAPPSPYRIEIDLGKQRAYLLKDGEIMAESPVSSGRPGHLTPTGDFSVIEKDLNHFSNLYGKIVEKGSGAVVKSGADSAMPVPKGCKFLPAPMKWFMRFEGASGMHAGILPGYAASHGCVRMPASKAELFYNTVDIGTPVHVFGTPPEHEEEEPRRHEGPVGQKAAPTPNPTPTPAHHGWWIFQPGRKA